MTVKIQPNDRGVFPKECAECIRYESQKATAEIWILDLGDRWISTASYEHKTGSHAGMCSPLTDHPSDRFPNREAAIQAAANRLTRGQDSILSDRGSCVNAVQLKEAAAIIRWCQELTNPTQPSFDLDL